MFCEACTIVCLFALSACRAQGRPTRMPPVHDAAWTTYLAGVRTPRSQFRVASSDGGAKADAAAGL